VATDDGYPDYEPDLRACSDCRMLLYALTPRDDWTEADEAEHRARVASRWPTDVYDLCGSETPGERYDVAACARPVAQHKRDE
jgi:hypothetical protein